MKVTRALKLGGAVAAATLTTVGGAAVAAWAGGAPGTQRPFAAAAVDEMPSIVETYDYPDAEQKFLTTGVRLTRGDGHIMLADCQIPRANNTITVRTAALTTIEAGVVCFKILGNTGFLQMQVPAVYEIDGRKVGAGRNTTAILTTEDGVVTPINVRRTEATQVGIGEDSEPTTLLELRVKP